jgi:crotonobetainyl-CoA:carnitine CoA-transferase CaiB-like acyl-CoA transferase
VKALDNIRIADFSHVMAGPFASHYLRLMGAEVVKVEAPGRGDAMRDYGGDRRYDGMAPGFIAVNAGKRSLVLDLKQEAAKEAARRLIAASDVVLENFRPGVMARLGLGYEACRCLRGDIVFCSVSGYGQTGPLRDYPAIDNIVQATSGLMSVSGEADGPPVRVGFPAVDTWTGMTAAFAIVNALLRRARSGDGAYIDVAMFDAALAFMTSAATQYLVTGKPLARTGNTGYSGQPTAGMFRAGDGALLSLGVVQQNQFTALCDVIGRADLAGDPRFASADLRKQNEAALREILAAAFAGRPGAHWEKALSEAGAPCGVVRSVSEAAALPGLAERNVFLPLHIPALPEREDVSIVNAGFAMGEDGPHVDAPPPRHGEHTRAILAELGYSAREIDALIAAGAAYACDAGEGAEP